MGDKLYFPDINELSDISRWCPNRLLLAKDDSHGLIILSVDEDQGNVKVQRVNPDGTLGIGGRMRMEELDAYLLGRQPGTTAEIKGDVIYVNQNQANHHGFSLYLSPEQSYMRRIQEATDLEWRAAIVRRTTTKFSVALANFEAGTAVGHALSRHISVVLDSSGAVVFLHKGINVGHWDGRLPKLNNKGQFLMQRITYLCGQ